MSSFWKFSAVLLVLTAPFLATCAQLPSVEQDYRGCSKPSMLYYSFMTPEMLVEQATYNSSYTVTPTELSFRAKARDDLLLRIPLVKQGVLASRTELTVKIVVAHNTDIGKKEDSDIRYGISDGQTFMGMEVTDPFSRGYDSEYPPCFPLEGASGLTLTNIKNKNRKNNDAKDAKNPGQFVITLKPSKQWGSCYIAHASGNTFQDIYQGQFSVDRGLNLEVYSDHANERYGIKYIEVTVIRDN